MSIVVTPFGCADDGTPVQLCTLDNGAGLRVQVATRGAALVSVRCPDRDGRSGEVLLGFDGLDGYLQPAQPYLGAIVGRCANRIAGGRFTLDGTACQLACNDGPNHLHGGDHGFDKRVWAASVEPADRAADADSGIDHWLCLRLDSADGDQGYPGRVQVMARYAVTPAGALVLDMTARCDRPTLVNLANHAYFNLAGEGDVLDHVLQLHAGRFTPVDAVLIPTGELRAVDGTPMDFRRPRRIGDGLRTDDAQLALAGGYDHNWVLDHEGDAHGERRCAELHEPRSGRSLSVRTTQPGVQFYSGNFLDGSLVGRGGRRLQKHAGLCLETQHFPDAPNQPAFPSMRLAPGERWQQRTVYRFGTVR